MERQELQKKTKVRVFNAMLVPILIYGCETWTIYADIQACKMTFLIKMSGRYDKAGQSEK